MQSKPTFDESNAFQEEETKSNLQTSPTDIKSIISSKDDTIQKRIDLQVYLHFERMLKK